MAIVSGKDFFGGKPGKVVQSASAPSINIPSKEERKSIFERLRSGISGIAQDVKETRQNVMKTIDDAGNEIDEAFGGVVRGEVNPLRAAGQAFGVGLGAASGTAGDIVTGAAKTILPQKAEEVLRSTVSAVARPVIENTPIKTLMENYQALTNDPSTEAQNRKRDIDALLGIGNFALDAIGTKAATRPASAVAKKGTQLLESVGRTGREVVEEASRAGTGIKNVGKEAASLVSNVTENISRVPSRVTANLAEKQAVRETINSLPTTVAKKAAQDGIDVPDVKYLYAIPKDQKGSLKKLYDVVKKFSRGDNTTNPIEVVGQPIVARIKELESSRGIVGKKLGEVSKNLGDFAEDEMLEPVLKRLKEVPGLSELRVASEIGDDVGDDIVGAFNAANNANQGALLDFSDTVLSSLSKSDRKAIQGAFAEAVKGGSGRQKHLLRQELFEILGGKKKSLSNMTDTQERAFDAIRDGLSDVLESRNSAYKTLSNDYRKIVQPLQDMRKFMKNVAGADEDILNMSAGLLARRITSNASSNPQIRSILRAMDEATKKAGKTALSVETLQDFYNVLERYYDIAAKTGFQGQIKSAMEFPSGAVDAVLKGVKSIAGETPAVRQRALERLLEEVLN